MVNLQSGNWLSWQGLVLGPLFFLIYINGLPLGLNIDVKLITDDSYNASVFVFSLNNDLVEIRD